jgi:hypothetical protein
MADPGSDAIDAPSLRSASNALAANVTLSVTNTFYDGPSAALSPGLWLASFHVTFARTTTTAVTYYARVTDKTTVYASGQQYQASVANHFAQMSMTAIIRLTTGTTIYGQGATSAGSSDSAMRYQMSGAGFGGNATMLTAVKIG